MEDIRALHQEVRASKKRADSFFKFLFVCLFDVSRCSHIFP